ncbi:MAG TPA: hypothetical protein VF170_14200 [Planctomycetaceae bacterium]
MSEQAASPEATRDDLRTLVEFAALPHDGCSRAERSLKLAGYSDEQIAKLLARTEDLHRRAA